MNLKRTPIAAVIASMLLMGEIAPATGGEIGANGDSLKGGVSVRDHIVGDVQAGKKGVDDGANANANANGGDALPVLGKTVDEGSANGPRTIITGAPGEDGGSGGAGGHGGASAIGGISTGGAAGNASASNTATANGGKGGDVTDHTITLTNTTLDGTGAAGGAGGSLTASSSSSSSSSSSGGAGAAGQGGGSVIGGISQGGAGGVASSPSSAGGGHGGNVLNNKITLAGTTYITGDIYGGISQGGAKGGIGAEPGTDGKGGLVQNNTITLMGERLKIDGSIYGGKSINGDGSVNSDADFSGFYQGNTLNLVGYRGEVKGIYNIEKYHWVLPKDVVNRDTLVKITGADAVALDHTHHSVAMQDDGKLLQTGDTVTLIDKVQGTPELDASHQVKQGHFLLYDASLDATSGQLELKIGKDGAGPAAVRIIPTAKAFLEGRLAMAALIHQGADMVSDSGMAAARRSADGSDAGLFIASEGGPSRYATGSHIDVRNIKLALGVSKGWALGGKIQAMAAALVEHGQGRYDSYNDFGSFGEVHGSGTSRYTGAGVLVHLAGVGQASAALPSFGAQQGLYLNAALRAGRSKNTFYSADLADASGVRGQYTSGAHYASAMVGAGYVLNLGSEQALDLYGRYTWSKLDSDAVRIGASTLDFGALTSSRMRLGARYSFAVSATTVPYAGLALEREFQGDASGQAYGMSIGQPSLKGNTGMVEVGVSMKPWAQQQALSLDVGLQGYFGKREGASASVKVKYVF